MPKKTRSKKPTVNWKQNMIRRGHAPLPRYGAYHVMMIPYCNEEYCDPTQLGFHAIFVAMHEYIAEHGGYTKFCKYVNWCHKQWEESQRLVLGGDPFSREQYLNALGTLSLYKTYRSIDWGKEDVINHQLLMKQAADLYAGWWT